ncbi:MAG: OmpH/Skp family outer membrane protein [Sulfuricaulis sp.]
MRKFVIWILLGLLFSSTAIAAEQPAIGYVNLQKVLVTSKVGKRNKIELDKLIAQKKSAISAAQEKLKAMQESYKKDQLLMTDDQKNAKEKEFQEKARAYQQMVDAANQAVNKKGNEFADSALAQIKPIIARIAREMKLSIVFDANDMSVLYAEKGMDLTQKVIEQYDAMTK